MEKPARDALPEKGGIGHEPPEEDRHTLEALRRQREQRGIIKPNGKSCVTKFDDPL
jgi:hypothetical protein